MKKLRAEQIQQLPELLKTKPPREIAKEWGVATSAIYYWKNQYFRKGIKLTSHKKPLIDKIINEQTNPTI